MKFGEIGILPHLPGVVLGPEEAGVLAGPGQRAFDEEGRQVDAGGDAVVARPEGVEAAGVVGPVAARRHLIELAAGDGRAGQHAVRGQEVVRLGVRERTDDGKPVGPCGEVRQMLGEPDPRNVRVDRLEFAADLGGRVGLRIEHVEMAGAAGEEDQHDRLGLAAAVRRRRRAGRLRQEAGEADAEQTGIADLQDLAPSQSGSVPVHGALLFELHGRGRRRQVKEESTGSRPATPAIP